MTRAELIANLQSSADDIRGFGATALYIFGSGARDELKPESDIDVFIDYNPEGPFSFVEWVNLEYYLADTLKRDVDLTARNGLHPRLRTEIERSSIKVI